MDETENTGMRWTPDYATSPEAQARRLALMQAQAPTLRLPLSLSAPDGEAGGIFDADGQEIATVDVNREMPDEDVLRIAALIVTCVNTAAGFRAEEVDEIEVTK